MLVSYDNLRATIIFQLFFDRELMPFADRRPYSWGRKDVLLFLDSVLRGLPLGSIIEWRPNKPSMLQNRVQKFLGPTDLSHAMADPRGAIMDGYARLSTLHWVMYGRPGCSAFTPEEDAVWSEDDCLVLDWQAKGFIFVPVQESWKGLRMPAYMLRPDESTLYSGELTNTIERRKRESWTEHQPEEMIGFIGFVKDAVQALNGARFGLTVMTYGDEQSAKEAAARANLFPA